MEPAAATTSQPPPPLVVLGFHAVQRGDVTRDRWKVWKRAILQELQFAVYDTIPPSSAVLHAQQQARAALILVVDHRVSFETLCKACSLASRGEDWTQAQVLGAIDSGAILPVLPAFMCELLAEPSLRRVTRQFCEHYRWKAKDLARRSPQRAKGPGPSPFDQVVYVPNPSKQRLTDRCGRASAGAGSHGRDTRRKRQPYVDSFNRSFGAPGSFGKVCQTARELRHLCTCDACRMFVRQRPPRSKKPNSAKSSSSQSSSDTP
jgi:hypothetical protein